MATPRHKLVDHTAPCFYHLVSRCVRRSWLCGVDKSTRRSYAHRKEWLVDRLHQLAQAYAVEVHAYAVMSNHFHLVVYYDPAASHSWSDEEVADRWLVASPTRDANGNLDAQARKLRREALLVDSERLRRVRQQLGSLSTFMKHLKQPIARRANLEDGCLGHFFDQRFYSAALLSENAVLAAMAYVDLNPIRARIAQSIEEAEHTSAAERIRAAAAAPERLNDYLEPLVSGIDGGPAPQRLRMRLNDYVRHLEVLAGAIITRQPPTGDSVERWQQRVSLLRRRQRVFGPANLIRNWLAARGLQLRELPLA